MSHTVRINTAAVKPYEVVDGRGNVVASFTAIRQAEETRRSLNGSKVRPKPWLNGIGR